MYSNSTHTAAQNSQGPLQSNGKSLTIVKSSPTNNADGQSGFVGSFLTQHDLQFHSVKASSSIQPNLYGAPSSALPLAKAATTALSHPMPTQARTTSPFQA